MTSKLHSIELLGLEACLVEIEVDKLGGIPNVIIVGLPDAAIKEATERVRSAIKNTGIVFPRNKIVVNLAPADLRKIGPRYDLAIALGILALEEVVDHEEFKKTIVIGELALNSTVRPVTGVLSSVDFARKAGFTRIMVPADNASEAGLIKGIKILPVKNLNEAILYFQKQLDALPIHTNIQIVRPPVEVDMIHIRGQHQAKRALEIAAAGGHNLLMKGAPGAGKTLMAKALPSILPSMSEQETLEVTKIYSVAGLLPKSQPLITERPFRSIHHTASSISIIGGGDVPKPGEITLAHRGVLFMDEIAEFPTHVLDVLRQPMENQWITISRARGSCTYPAHFTLVAAMNPCNCGYFNVDVPFKQCTCTSHQIRLYQKRLSGPLLDRIDMHLNIRPVDHKELAKIPIGETSAIVKKRVEQAALIQRERFKKEGLTKNAEMQNRHLNQCCKLDRESVLLLQTTAQSMNLSARSYFRTIKLARTIADLEQVSQLRVHHLAEALHYKIGLKN